jgi:hypothetical protein
MTKESKQALKDDNKRYTITMINRNGYTIIRKFNTIQSCITLAKHFPLTVFFAWIYDKVTDTMVMQNDYKDKMFKCDNESFVPYW